MSSTTAQPRNRRYISQWRKQKLRWRENSAPKRIQAAQQQQCGYVCIQARLISTNPGSMEEAYEVWATAWDVFRRAPSRVGRGGRAAVDFVVCFGWGGFFSVFFFVFISSNAHGLLQVRGHLASSTSLLVCSPVILLTALTSRVRFSVLLYVRKSAGFF